MEKFEKMTPLSLAVHDDTLRVLTDLCCLANRERAKQRNIQRVDKGPQSFGERIVVAGHQEKQRYKNTEKSKNTTKSGHESFSK